MVSRVDANSECMESGVSAAPAMTYSTLDQVHSYCVCCTAISITRWFPVDAVWNDVTRLCVTNNGKKVTSCWNQEVKDAIQEMEVAKNAWPQSTVNTFLHYDTQRRENSSHYDEKIQNAEERSSQANSIKITSKPTKHSWRH